MFRTRLGRVATLSVAAVAVLVGSLYGVISVLGSVRHEAAVTAWDARFGSWDEVLERYPARGPSETALRLEELAARLGIDLATYRKEGRHRPGDDDRAGFKNADRSAARYVQSQMERVDRGIEPPPAELADFLVRHRETIAEIHRTLDSASPPRWELDLALEHAAPVPNLLGHIGLQRVLLADALAHAAAGDAPAARASLEASWRLNGGLRDDPVLITQLVALSITRMQAGILRHVDVEPRKWIARLDALELRPRMFVAMRTEVRHWSSITEMSLGATWAPADESASQQMLRGTAAKLMAPYVRLCVADVTQRALSRMDNLEQLDYLCDRDRRAQRADFDDPLAPWNYLGKIYMPGLGNAVDRVARMEVDVELTRKVLELEALRDRGDAWPEALAEERSEACPADHWIYEKTPWDTISIRLSREPEWSRDFNRPLPVRFDERAPDTPVIRPAARSSDRPAPRDEPAARPRRSP